MSTRRPAAARRHRLRLAGAIVLASAAVLAMLGCTGHGERSAEAEHGDPDPGHAILTALQTAQEGVPPQATDVRHENVLPKWDSCDAQPGTAGWDDIEVIITFDTTMPAEDLLAFADERLVAAGWTHRDTLSSPIGPAQTWDRRLADGTTATASLGPNTRDGTSIYWQLRATAPPHGQRSSGC